MKMASVYEGIGDISKFNTYYNTKNENEYSEINVSNDVDNEYSNIYDTTISAHEELYDGINQNEIIRSYTDKHIFNINVPSTNVATQNSVAPKLPKRRKQPYWRFNKIRALIILSTVICSILITAGILMGIYLPDTVKDTGKHKQSSSERILSAEEQKCAVSQLYTDCLMKWKFRPLHGSQTEFNDPLWISSNMKSCGSDIYVSVVYSRKNANWTNVYIYDVSGRKVSMKLYPQRVHLAMSYPGGFLVVYEDRWTVETNTGKVITVQNQHIGDVSLYENEEVCMYEYKAGKVSCYKNTNIPVAHIVRNIEAGSVHNRMVFKNGLMYMSYYGSLNGYIYVQDWPRGKYTQKRNINKVFLCSVDKFSVTLIMDISGFKLDVVSLVQRSGFNSITELMIDTEGAVNVVGCVITTNYSLWILHQHGRKLVMYNREPCKKQIHSKCVD